MSTRIRRSRTRSLSHDQTQFVMPRGYSCRSGIDTASEYDHPVHVDNGSPTFQPDRISPQSTDSHTIAFYDAWGLSARIIMKSRNFELADFYHPHSEGNLPQDSLGSEEYSNGSINYTYSGDERLAYGDPGFIQGRGSGHFFAPPLHGNRGSTQFNAYNAQEGRNQFTISDHSPSYSQANSNFKPLSSVGTTPSSASTAASAPSHDRLTKKYECEELGCAAKFNRPADLQRHRLHIHQPHPPAFHCDYRHCGRAQDPFRRKDHLRDHLREYHLEDIGCAKRTRKSSSETHEEEEKRWLRKQQTWLEARRVDSGNWRCEKCLRKNLVALHQWTCGKCNYPCSEERIARRLVGSDSHRGQGLKEA